MAVALNYFFVFSDKPKSVAEMIFGLPEMRSQSSSVFVTA